MLPVELTIPHFVRDYLKCQYLENILELAIFEIHFYLPAIWGNLQFQLGKSVTSGQLSVVGVPSTWKILNS